MENTTNVTTETNFTDSAELQNSQNPSLDIISINKSVLFNNEQCDNILKNTIDELWLPTKVVGDKDLHIAHRQKLRGDIAGFPFMEIRHVTKQANTFIYDFDLLGIIDQDFPQIYRYSKDNYYNWHTDINVMSPSRKITFIINLSNKDSYEGGEIEFLNIDTSEYNVSEQGYCLIFPSYIPYRINEVKSGNKFIIVGHIHGALFK
jgi:PKHD-type hydroxylase